MSRCAFFLFGALVYLCAYLSKPAVPTAAETRSDFAALSARLRYLAIDSVLWDRPDRWFPVERDREIHNEVVRQAGDRAYTDESLQALLVDRDAKVRTLAAVALFDRNDPSILPALVRLCSDQAPTFDGYLPSALSLPNSRSAPRYTPQTVADVARKMVDCYLQPAGFHYGIKHDSEPGFAEYWQARKDRPYCASWFEVQLQRASQGIEPTPPETVELIRAVRHRIDRLPMPDRGWILLSLRNRAGAEELVSEPELVDICKQLGRENLLALLRNRILSEDPDLQPRRNNNSTYGGMKYFVLRHAEQLFKAEDSDALLECERWERDYQKHGRVDPLLTPWWAIAAARLQPQRAAVILNQAMERFQDRFDAPYQAELMAARWELVGQADLAAIVDWFYKAGPTEQSGGGQLPFLDSVNEKPNCRQLTAAIIRDARLPELDWPSIQKLLQMVNGWCPQPVVSDDEMRSLHHPFGSFHFDPRQLAEAKEEYPEQTAEVQKVLHSWCDKLRESLPKWAVALPK